MLNVKRIVALTVVVAMLLGLASFSAIAETSSAITPTVVEETFKTPKKVNLQLKKTLSGIGNYFSGHFAPPDETIYVGDTVVISHDVYSQLFPDGVDTISVGLQRIGDTEGDTGATSWLYSTKDAAWTVGIPGKYQVVVSSFEKDKTQIQSYIHGAYNCVFEVLETPVSAPKTVQAPTYTGEVGTVGVLVESTAETIADESKAFMIHYNRNLGYADFQKPVNTELEFNSYPGLLEYYQFNLDKMAYVDNVVMNATAVDYADILASVDGEHWYKLALNQKIENNTAKVGAIAKYIRVRAKSFNGWGSCSVSSYTINGYAVLETDVIVPEYDDSHIATDNAGVAPKEIELVVNEAGTRFKVPDGVAVNVGDTLVFDTETFLDVNGTQRALAGGAWWYFVTIPSGTRYDPFNEPEHSYLISSKNSEFASGRFLVRDIGTYTAYTQFWGKPVWGSFGGGWCETFTVSDVAGDPEEVRKYSNEIISEPKENFFISDKSTQFTLSFDVKMIQNEKPMFTYYSDANGKNEITPNSETITFNYSDSTGYYYTVDAVFNVTGEETTVFVKYGLNYRFELGIPVGYTRTLSEELFEGEIFTGENSLRSTAYALKPGDTVILSLNMQKVIEGSTIAVNGTQYTNLRVELEKVVSEGDRFDYVDAQTDFYYNQKDGTWDAIVTAKKDGIDVFVATLNLIGYDADKNEDVVLDTRELVTEYFTVKTPPVVVSWDNVVGGEPGSDKFNKAIAQLKDLYADKDYVLVDMTNPNRETYMSGAAWNREVSAEFWNALKDMNKSRIIFRGTYNRYDGTYTGVSMDQNGDFTSYIQTMVYEIEINKEDHNMLDLISGKRFSVGFDSNYLPDRMTQSREDVANAVQEALGYGRVPYYTSIILTNAPFVSATVRVEVAPFWYAVNGWKDCTIYEVERPGSGGATLNEKFTDVELKALYTATERPFTYDFEKTPFSRYYEVETGTSFYYVLAGEDTSVDLSGKTDKNNVATGGADMATMFATFSVIALGALLVKKQK